ncbi:Hpt domain-containing protein [Marinilabiliaceae bacterium ANBcel2]|nr:Hpt domain-containing protein [Marinilabiliaceae bacterium ANBcel2]
MNNSGNRYTNLKYLNEISNGDKNIIKELITIFLEQIEEFSQGFKINFDKKRWKELAGLAHKAKSSVISMGMEELGNNDLKNIELLAKKERIKEIEKKGSLSKAEIRELQINYDSIEGCPYEKKKWLKEVDSIEQIKNIINKFGSIINKAKTELKEDIENL